VQAALALIESAQQAARVTDDARQAQFQKAHPVAISEGVH
jgi:hypothetical protein